MEASDTGWTLWHPTRPLTTNNERRLHHYERAKIVKEWRTAFYFLAKKARIPELAAIEIEAIPFQSGRGRIQDVGGCMPSVKAAIDGLVDAKVIPDDGPKYLKAICFKAPVTGTPGLKLIVRQAA